MTVTALTPRQPQSPQFPLDAGLQLEAALSLLRQAGRDDLPGERGSTEWLQSVIDALCDLSVRDALTGLANRRHFEMALSREVDRVARSGEPALLLVLDIDHFKAGQRHPWPPAAGDVVLQVGGAQVLSACVRPMDTLARVRRRGVRGGAARLPGRVWPQGGCRTHPPCRGQRHLSESRPPWN